MAKETNLTIKDFQLGIAPSPYLGFAEMRNVDIFTAPGSMKISQRLKTSGNSTSIITGTIKWFVQNPVNGDVYAVDSTGKVYWYVLATDTWSVIGGNGAGNGEGLAIWNDYLILARPGNLDTYGPLSGAPVWTVAWQALTTPKYSAWHPMLTSGQRFVLYIGNDYWVDTLEQNAGQTFDPGNPATYTYNSQDLELGSYYQVTSLEESGSNIAIGTTVGINATVNIADTFYWDGFSDFISGSSTVHFADNGVWQMKNLGNTLYTIAGTGRTRLFASTVAQGIEVKRLNNITLGNVLFPFVGAIDQKDGELLFGVSSVTGPNGSSPMGVYSYRDKAYVLRNIISTGNDGTGGGIYIGAILTYTPDLYFVSYFDEVANKFGVDTLALTYYTGYKARVDSALYQVGTVDDPKTFERIQVRMGKPLNAGDKVRVSARYDLNSSWSVIAEFDTVAVPALVGRSTLDASVRNVGSFVDMQVRIELDTAVNSTISPELMNVTIT